MNYRGQRHATRNYTSRDAKLAPHARLLNRLCTLQASRAAASKHRSTCRIELLKAGGIEMLPKGAGFAAANTAGSVGGTSAAATVYVCCWNAAGLV